MSRWNDTSDFRTSTGPSAGRSGAGQPGFDRWTERTCSYLKSRTADHWLMFAGGLLIGALLA